MNNDLNRLSGLLQDAVEHGEYAGASVMVLRKGEEIYYTDYGYADVESCVKITRDTHFKPAEKRNGLHQYVVTVVDKCWNESIPSKTINW